MKRIFILLLIVSLLFSITACTSDNSSEAANQVEVVQEDDREVEEKPIIKDNFSITFETEIEADFDISDEDYKKYNDIMDYLYDFPEKSEDELFKELAETYGETAEKLKRFMSDNMEGAITRDMVGNTLKVEDVDNLVNKFVAENIIGDSISVKSINTEIQGVGSISHVDLEVNGNKHILIFKLRFSDDYKTAEVIQVKIDEINIDLP